MSKLPLISQQDRVHPSRQVLAAPVLAVPVLAVPVLAVPVLAAPMLGWLLPLACLLSAGCADDPVREGASTSDAASEVVSADGGCAHANDCAADDDPCTIARCTPEGCVQEARLDGAACSDGDPCTESDACQAGVCAGVNRCACQDDVTCSVVMEANLCLGTPWCDKRVLPYRCARKPDAPFCPSGGDTLCQTNTCDPTTGTCAKLPRNQGAACVDGDHCTGDDQCDKGQCKGVTPLCACKKDADCPDDKDLCTAELYCDSSVHPNVCRPNVATQVSCPTKAVGPCQSFACDPKDGVCKTSSLADGTQCDDGAPCTAAGSCTAGSCTPGATTCTCTKQSDCKQLEDGDYCNGTLYCEASSGTCKVNPKTLVTCPTGGNTACKKNLCNPQTGTCAVTAVVPGTPCNDGNPCTIDEICVIGVCGKGTNVCKCKSDADCGDLDDNLCDGTAFCNKQTLHCEQNGGQAIQCPTGEETPCSKNACVRKTGKCVVTPIEQALAHPYTKGLRWEVRPVGMSPGATATCDDGDACTLGDQCSGGVCAPQIFGCACKIDADCSDDGNLCNGVPWCDKTDPKQAVCKTKPNSAVTCKTVDDTACRKRTCQPKTGVCALLPLPAGLPCDDGNSCTKSDHCLLGTCAAGAMVCDCQKNSDCSDKEDGNLCNGTLYCDKTDPAKPACKLNPATVVQCPAQALAACQAWTCNSTSGQCLLVAGDEGSTCDDGNACSTKDRCTKGSCLGAKVSCDDGDACTVDSCAGTGTCIHTKTGCDDGNSCTVDTCNTKTGACSANVLAANGKTCDGDGTGCTVNDTCDKGVCHTGKVVSCPAGGAACSVGVCASLGSFDFKCVTTAAPKGANCDDGDSCTVRSTCVGGQCKPTGDEVLYSRILAPKLGVRGGFRAVAPLPGGGAYAAGWSAAPLAGPATWAAWWVTQVDAAGVPVWHGHLPSQKPVDGVQAVAVRQTSAGQALAIGSLVHAGAIDLDATAAAWDAAGKLLWQQSVGLAKVPDGLTGGAEWPGSGFVAAGWQGTVHDGVLVRISGGGQVVWRVVTGGKAADALHAATPMTDGGALGVGQEKSSKAGVTRGWLVRSTPQGKVAWQQQLGESGTQRLDAVVTLAGGDVLAAGWQGTLAQPKRWLVRATADGSVRWSRVSSAAIAVHAATRVGERILLAGRARAGGTNDLWLMATDGQANQVWDGGFAGVTSDEGYAVAGTDAAVWVAGETVAAAATGGPVGSKAAKGLIIRRDAWGHASCAAAAGCEKKALSTCDDGKACTQDTCAKGTCQHGGALGWRCDPADGCVTEGLCAQGLCKAEANGKRFIKELKSIPGIKDFTKVLNVVQTPGGGTFLGLERKDQLVAHWVGIWLDALGEITHVRTGTFTKCQGVQGVLPLADGSVVVAWQYALSTSKPGHYQIKVSRVSATNTAVWPDRIVCTPSDQAACVTPAHYTTCGSGKLVALNDGKTVLWTSIVGTGNTACTVSGQKAFVQNTGRLAVKVALTTGASAGSFNVYGGRVHGNNTVLKFGGGEWIKSTSARSLSDNSVVLWGRMFAYEKNTHNENAVFTGYPAYVERRGAGYNWRKTYFLSKAAQATFNGVVETDFGLLLVGRQWSNLGSNRTFVGVDNNGKVLWSRVEPESTVFTVRGALEDSVGGLLWGNRAAGGGQRPYLLGIDQLGKTQWQRSWSLSPDTWVPGYGYRASDGGVVLAGKHSLQGTDALFVMRTNPWGHATCTEAAGCNKQTLNSCDDGDVCTADLCDAKSGKCANQPSSGAACDDGAACTGKDACQLGKCVGKAIAGCTP